MKLAFERKGSGPKVLLIHGFLEDQSMWNGLRLHEHFDCLSIDLPGHGLSEIWHNSDANLEYVAYKVNEIIVLNNFQNCHVIGHSLGGYVALELIQQTLISGKCILMNSNFWEDSVQKKKDRLRVVEIVKSNKSLFITEAIPSLFFQKEKYPNEIQGLVKSALLMDSETVSAASLAMRNRLSRKELLVQQPERFFIVQGDKDQSTKLTDMSNRNPGAHMLTILNCGHMSHLEKPHELITGLVEFVKEGSN